jgi:hypothetical protein
MTTRHTLHLPWALPAATVTSYIWVLSALRTRSFPSALETDPNPRYAVKVSAQTAILTNSENQNASERAPAIALNRSTAPQTSATSRTVNSAKRWSADCARTIKSEFS